VVALISPPAGGKTNPRQELESRGYVGVEMSELLTQHFDRLALPGRDNGATWRKRNVSDQIVNTVFSDFLRTKPHKPHLVISGYPRTKNQADFFLYYMRMLGYRCRVTLLDVSDNTCIDRFLIRSKTGSLRPEDNLDDYATRLMEYRKTIGPLKAFLERGFCGSLFSVVDGHLPKPEVARAVVAAAHS
jgi:adenylate kinase family enzyme